MEHGRIIMAFQATNLLANSHELTETEHWNVYCLRKKMKEHVEFQAERETQLEEKYRQYADENGVLRGEKAREYREELDEISRLDVEIETGKKFRIPMINGMTCAEMEALEDFIEFYRDEPEENAPGVC